MARPIGLYVEEDQPNPRNVYAVSKLLGEWFVDEAPRSYVLRVESLFGQPGPEGSRRGSLGSILDRILANEEVPVFVDRTVSPTYTADVARATRAIIERGLAPGLYHCVNAGAASWPEVAGEAAQADGGSLSAKRLKLASAQRGSRRPPYCALVVRASRRRRKSSMPTWQKRWGGIQFRRSWTVLNHVCNREARRQTRRLDACGMNERRLLSSGRIIKSANDCSGGESFGGCRCRHTCRSSSSRRAAAGASVRRNPPERDPVALVIVFVRPDSVAVGPSSTAPPIVLVRWTPETCPPLCGSG